MRHVDEGALHAYLDGALDAHAVRGAERIRAHLERCAACRGRLEEARVLRDEAAAILSEAAPAVVPPSLEDLRRLAGAGRAGHGVPRSVRLRRLGWAASIVVAAGAGWGLRDGLPGARPGDPGASSSAPAGPAADAAPAPRGPVAAVEVVEPPSAPAGAATAPSAPRPGGGAEPRPAAAAAGPPEAAGTRAGAEGSGSLRGSVAVPAPAQERAARIREGSATPRAALPAAVVEAPRDEEARPAAVEGRPSPGAPSVPAEAAEDVLPRARPGERGDRRAEPSRSALGFRSAAPGGSLPPLPRAEERPGGRSRAADDSGSLVVPGLEVLTIVWRQEGVTPAGVRVLQRYAEDVTLELLHLPEGVDPSSIEPAPAGSNELVVDRPNGWLVLRAPLDPAVLEELLRRLDQAR